MSDWIKCSDRLPEDGESGLCAMHKYDSPSEALIVVPFTFIDGQFHPFADEDNLEMDYYWTDPMYWPSHWMPFPEPPKEDV